jgi:hemoglobin
VPTSAATTPETQPPPDTPFGRLGGAATFRRIVDRFYDLMDSDAAYAGIRALHAEDLAPMRQSLASFLGGWAGGPRDWFEANPGRCMMSIHKPYPIDQELARQWAGAMKRAIADTPVEDAGLAGQMALMLERMAEGLGS